MGKGSLKRFLVQFLEDFYEQILIRLFKKKNLKELLGTSEGIPEIIRKDITSTKTIKKI